MAAKLSSVLNMARDFASIRRTVAALSRQTARDDIELIIIARRSAVHTIDRAMLQVFAAHQVIEVDTLSSGAYGWAEGFRRAQAPVVVISEDHGYPSPNWAQTLIDAHAADDCFAVCPAIENGNPKTRTSWANFLLSFVEWFEPDQPKLVQSGAGHNTSYKREALLRDYGGALDRWLNPERVLHYDLIARGKKILLDSRASVAHVNLSRPAAFFGVSYAGGRVFGASRAAGWGGPRKLLHALLFWLVPFVRLKRLLAFLDTPQKRRKARFIGTLPMILAGLFCHAFGEAVGYLFGAGNIGEKYVNFELNRLDYVVPEERGWMLGACEGPAYAA